MKKGNKKRKMNATSCKTADFDEIYMVCSIFLFSTVFAERNIIHEGGKMTIDYRFASEILRARTEQKRTQEWVAKKAGISERWYKSIESGKVRPSFWIGIQIAAALKLDMNRFLRDTANGMDDSSIE